MPEWTRLAPLLLTAILLFGCGGGSDDDGAEESVQLDPVIEGSVKLGGAPVAVAAGEGGAWVADNTASTVTRLEPSSGKATGKPIEVAAGPLAIATGEGAVWVASGDGTITRIDPDSEEASEIGEPLGQPGGIAAGEGSVWVSNVEDSTLVELDPDTGDVLGETEIGELPSDVVIAGGSVWVANGNDGTVSRVDAESGEVSDTLEVAGLQVLALAADEDGVFVAGTDDELVESVEVTRIDPSSGELSEEPATIETGTPVRLAAGEGAVWAAAVGPLAPSAEASPGSVTVIDPATGEAYGEPLETGIRPSGIAAGEGGVFVTNSDGTVTLIAPGS